jgi:hypothetical protein
MTSLAFWFLRPASLNAAIVYQRSLWINGTVGLWEAQVVTEAAQSMLFSGQPIPNEEDNQQNQKDASCKSDPVQYAGRDGGDGGLGMCAVEFVERTNNAVRSTGKSHKGR